MAGPQPWARYSFGSKGNVRIVSGPAELADGTYSFPACSATSLEIDLAGPGG
jgi:hypothetical protein